MKKEETIEDFLRKRLKIANEKMLVSYSGYLDGRIDELKIILSCIRSGKED